LRVNREAPEAEKQPKLEEAEHGVPDEAADVDDV
jgi:hypothetical protein